MSNRVASCMVCWLALGGATAAAQLRADRLYFGAGRPVIVHVTRPADAPGEISLELIDAAGASAARAPAAEGPVNLLTLFPEFESGLLRSGDGVRILYAQLSVGAERAGPPLVIQPLKGAGPAQMTDPATGAGLVVDPSTRKPNFPTRAGVITYGQREIPVSGVRIYEDRTVIFETTLGEIEFAMRPDAAPNTAFNFLHLAEGGLYQDVIFHRVVAKTPEGHPFVIQTGDPTGTGDGGPGYSIDLEPSTLAHDFGVLSVARDDDPDSGGSQVFVALSRDGTRRLDGRYTAFGEVVRGADVVNKIAAVPVAGDNHRPLDPPRIIRASTRSAAPFGKRPARQGAQ